MKKSLFVIEQSGGSFEDSWKCLNNWGFTTYEKAEKFLFSRHWKRTKGYSGIIYESMLPDIDEYYDSYMARIIEINYWEN